MNRTAFDENGHADHNQDTKEQHGPPVLLQKKMKGVQTTVIPDFGTETHRNPFSNGQQGLLVENQVLESGKRSFGINFATFEKDVAIALEVVTR